MNIRLEKVVYRDRRGRVSSMDDLFITGRNVRYVHIPDHMNIIETIETQLAKIHRCMRSLCLWIPDSSFLHQDDLDRNNGSLEKGSS
ncbi:hypothetical protein Q8A67_015827 [Cirrhinus molitorella]|uniref:Sm domain-containing protein n=1 Tax=Cirrhinus molitorella TaxID=172907 RepID=A0AA88TJ70_9TELE|nr:hypothetical protein Q8A67_015827 [Cirrhinus molitorella]